MAKEILESGLDYLFDNKRMEIDIYNQLSIAYKGLKDNDKSQMYFKKAESLLKDNQ